MRDQTRLDNSKGALLSLKRISLLHFSICIFLCARVKTFLFNLCLPHNEMITKAAHADALVLRNDELPPGCHLCLRRWRAGAKEKSLTYLASWDEGSVGNRSLDSQHVHTWQSFAQGRPTQRHCVHVIGTLQQQMKLSAGRWLSSDSHSALSLHSAANKYVGFQSCQGRRWTVGQGAKRRAKAFPSPCNLLSMSLVTSLGHPFSVSHPKGPGGPQISHTACRGMQWASLSLPLSLPVRQPSLSLFSARLCVSPKTSLSREKRHQKHFKAAFVTECKSVWRGWWATCPRWLIARRNLLSLNFLWMVESELQRQRWKKTPICVFVVWAALTDHLQCESFSSATSHFISSLSSGTKKNHPFFLYPFTSIVYRTSTETVISVSWMKCCWSTQFITKWIIDSLSHLKSHLIVNWRDF